MHRPTQAFGPGTSLPASSSCLGLARGSPDPRQVTGASRVNFLPPVLPNCTSSCTLLPEASSSTAKAVRVVCLPENISWLPVVYRKKSKLLHLAYSALHLQLPNRISSLSSCLPIFPTTVALSDFVLLLCGLFILLCSNPLPQQRTFLTLLSSLSSTRSPRQYLVLLPESCLHPSDTSVCCHLSASMFPLPWGQFSFPCT